MVQKAIKRALDETGVSKQASSHIFRHFECLCHAGLRPGKPNHPLERNQDNRTIQELLGPKDVMTTMVYTHALNRGPSGVRSPADLL